MLLKKQTVWLLTMLSLVIVLSVYYVTSEPTVGDELASVEDKSNAEAGKDSVATSKDGKTIVTETSGDEGFESLRLQLTDQRNQLKEDLETLIGSTDLPAEERSEAIDKMNELREIANKEQMIETLLTSTMGYDDALVRADGDHVRVTVKSKKEHSAKAANEIIQLVRNEIGAMKITAVEFQPSK